MEPEEGLTLAASAEEPAESMTGSTEASPEPVDASPEYDDASPEYGDALPEVREPGTQPADHAAGE
jgi:hypothetical protein